VGLSKGLPLRAQAKAGNQGTYTKTGAFNRKRSLKKASPWPREKKQRKGKRQSNQGRKICALHLMDWLSTDASPSGKPGWAKKKIASTRVPKRDGLRLEDQGESEDAEIGRQEKGGTNQGIRPCTTKRWAIRSKNGIAFRGRALTSLSKMKGRKKANGNRNGVLITRG